jgi:hypothetical protein
VNAGFTVAEKTSMKDSRTFVTMFIDSGTFSGRMANNLSQIGGWSVYIFTDSVVFLTMPLGDRISVFAGPALGLFSHHPWAWRTKQETAGQNT